ncbi:MAG: hypothetical protein B7Y07_02260 [Halothiobacillus sp. 24-54-40]|jgi:hypothetical protein|nr:MAG: hypothetical protein B7Y58_01865 [Halothiobacillus sp. 35-54-62]OYY51262.1 MAG: hypothetical protein B7Y53_09380 [Halothiobacillus sp. 28-55-5]OYZ87970.1 MAG: hypothetical protein B7Y07_02260 [Halothiobacillus sp. 24-54-40]OZA81412.1 MAG: hypothetical protein B7X64_01495 [Halothiobacillus sp. 39-53-45]HQS02181.1 hypothetical protein [Halothiobacillus sp.]
MDAALMQLMARFKLKLLRTLAVKVDTYRFIAERAYAMDVLAIADQSEDEDLIILAMQVSDYLGFLEPPATAATGKAPATQSPATPRNSPAPADAKRYTFGARG